MNKIRLLVGDNQQEVDISKSFNIELKYSLKDLQDYGARTASFSKSIKVINNDKSFNVFKNLFDIDSEDAYTITSNVKAIIELDSVPIINGLIKIEKITKDYYDVVVYTANVDIFTRVGDKLIYGNSVESDDIIFSSVTNHIPSRDYIRNSWDNYTNGDDFIYPFINHGNNFIFSYNTIVKNSPYYVYPALSAYKLFDEILTSNGYTYEFSSDIEQYLQRMYIPYNGNKNDIDIIFPSTELAKVNFYDASYNTYIEEGELRTYSFNGTDFRVFTKLNLDQPQTFNNYIYNDSDFLEPSNINTHHTGDISLTIDTANGSRNPDFDVFDGDKTEIGFAIYERDGTITSKTVELDYDTVVETGNPIIPKVWEAVPQQVTFNFNDVSYDSEIYLIIKYKNTGENPAFYALLNSSTENNITMKYNDWVYSTTETRNENDFRPRNYKQKDFLKDVLNTFNAFVLTDDIDQNKLIIKSYTEFYNNREILNITDYIDVNTIEHKSLANEQPLTTNFIMGEDSDDLRVNDYDEQFERTYGSKLVLNRDINTGILNNIASGDNDIELNYSSTIMEQFPGSQYTFTRFAQIYNGESFSTEFAPRLLFVNINDGGYEWGGDSIDNSTLNMISVDTNYNFYANNTDNLCLKFDNEDRYVINSERPLLEPSYDSNVTIYNKYYKKDLERRFSDDSRILNLSAVINETTLNKLLKFNNYIIIDNYGIYRLESIKKYTLNTKEADLVLVKEIDDSILTYLNTITVNDITILSKSESGDDGTSTGGGGSSVTQGITQAEADIRYAFKNGELTEDFSVSNLYTDGNVGVGTQTPLSALHIDKGVGSLINGISFGDGDTGIFESADDTLKFAINNTNVMTINPNGYVGVGTENPTDAFHLLLDGNYEGFTVERVGGKKVQLGAGTGAAYFEYSDNFIFRKTGQSYGQINIDGSNNIYLGSAMTGNGVGATMTILNNDRVGIGTANPSAILHVVGDTLIKPSSVGDGGIKINNLINGYSSINWISNLVGLGLIAGGGIATKISSGSLFAIGTGTSISSTSSLFGVHGNGRVIVGGGTPQSLLHINGGVGSLSTGLSFGDGDTGLYELVDDTLIFKTTGTDRFQILGDSFRSILNGGGSIVNANSSSTVPTLLPRANSTTTGIGSSGSDVISIITNGFENINITSGNTSFVSNLKGSGTFIPGFVGDNWLLDADDEGDAHLTVDNLTVRKSMRIYELQVKKIRNVGGALMISNGIEVLDTNEFPISIGIFDQNKIWKDLEIAVWDFTSIWPS